jgi:hypothetical protein
MPPEDKAVPRNSKVQRAATSAFPGSLTNGIIISLHSKVKNEKL